MTLGSYVGPCAHFVPAGEFCQYCHGTGPSKDALTQPEPTAQQASEEALTLKDVEARTIKLMQAASTREGMKLSDWVAHRMREAAERALSAQQPCPAPKPDDETYYTKGKDAPWFEALSDKDFAEQISHAAMDLNDTGLGDDLDKWMPFQAMMSDAGSRIARLIASKPQHSPEALIKYRANLVAIRDAARLSTSDTGRGVVMAMDTALADFDAALSAQQAAGEAEAVAWLYERDGKRLQPVSHRHPELVEAGFSERALYATPQPTETQRIVAWLLEVADEPAQEGDAGQALARRIAARFFANAIARGEHLAGDKA